MEMQLIKESLRMEQPLDRRNATAIVDGEVTLPGGLREEARVLAAEAMAAVETAEAMNDRVSVRGRVAFHVLYTQGDPTKVNAIEATADFTQSVELPGCHTRASAQAEAAVNRVEARAVNGRLHLRAEVAVEASAMNLAPVEVITGVENTGDVQMRTTEVSLCRTAAKGSGDVLLREEIALPAEMQIRQTLFARAYPVVEAVTGGLGRIGLTGQMQLEAVHASALPGRPVVVTRHSIPFTESVEISGEDGDILSGTVTVKDTAVASQEDADGTHTLRAEVLLGLAGRADKNENHTLLSDAYTLSGDELRLSGQTVSCRVGSREISAAESGKTTLLLPENAPPVRTVLAAFATPRLQEMEQIGGRSAAVGMLEATLLYMTDGSDVPVSVRVNENFRVTFPEQISPQAQTSLEITGAEAVPITSDRMELRYILRLRAREDQTQQTMVTTEGKLVPSGEITNDMVLCFTQPGETMWDIARRYRVSMDGVKALNPDLTAEPPAGQGVLVWRRREASV